MANDPLIELQFGLPGPIYRSPMPFGPYDPQGEMLNHYREQGVDTILVLVEEEEALAKTQRNLLALYTNLGFEVLQYPIPDFSIPAVGLIDEAIATCIQRAQTGHSVVVHCNAGIGRTGLVMACLAKRILGLDGGQAVEWVRQFIPHAVETPDQARFVLEY